MFGEVCKVKRSILQKSDALTEYQTLFWFAMVISKYEPEFHFRKGSKVAKFEQVLYLGGGGPLCYEPNRCGLTATAPLNIERGKVLQISIIFFCAPCTCEQ